MTTHIHIPDVSPVIQASGNGSQKVFAFPFPIFWDSDLEVRIGSTVLITGYTVFGAGSSKGGAVVFATAPANGSRVTLRRKQTYARTDDFLDERAPTPHELNDAVDLNVAAIQELAEQASRSVQRPLSADLSQPVALDLPVPEAGKVLGWNGSANGLVNLAQVEISNVLLRDQNLADLTDAAAARSNLGLGSAAALNVDTDTTLAADSDSRLPSQKAVKAYVASQVAGGVPTLRVQVFTASGTFTVPTGATAGTTFKVTVVGGGGGGYSGYTGGGGGGTAIYYASGLSAGQTVTVTVGANGSDGQPGTAGTASSIVIGATTVVANGGAAGTASAGTATPGGGATGGTLNIGGSASLAGCGNGNYYGGGGSLLGFGATNNSYATGYGGAGSWNGGSYGNGTPGVVIFEWIA